MTESEEDRIRVRAYEIWEAMGCPEGQHEATWQQAQIEIAARDAYGLEADTLRVMQNTAVGNDMEGADFKHESCVSPPTLDQLKACVSD